MVGGEKKSIWGYCIFVGLLYLFLFDPPMFIFRGILRFSNVLIIISIIYHILYKSFFVRYLKCLKNEFFLIGLLVVFSLLRMIIGGEITFVNKSLMFFLSLLVVVPFLLSVGIRIGIHSEKDFTRVLLIVATTATALSLTCLLSPDFQQYVKESLIQYSPDDYLARNKSRGFGVASLLTSNYGFILGFLAAYGCLFYKNNRWYLFFAPLVLFSALINARTGAIIAFGIIIIFMITEKQKFISSIVIIVGTFLVANFEILMNYFDINAATIDFIMSFYDQISEVATSGDVSKSSNAGDLLGAMIIMPEYIDEWIMGRGYDLFAHHIGVGSSDNGFIRQLNYGGLMYYFLLCSLLFAMLSRLARLNRYRFIAIFIFTCAVVNIKTLLIPGCSIFYLLFILYFYKVNVSPFRNQSIVNCTYL